MTDVLLRDYVEELRALLRDGRLNDALALARHILQFFPKHLETYRLLAEINLELNDDDAAADLFNRVRSVDPESVIALIGLSMIREHSGALDEATRLLERAFELQPNNAELRQELLRLHGAASENPPARVKLSPAGLARLYARQGLSAQAIREYRSLLRADPARQDLQVALMEALYHEGHKQEAARVAEAILEALPYCLKANLFLSKLWEENGVPEAEGLKRRALDLDPDQVMARELGLADEEYPPPNIPALQGLTPRVPVEAVEPPAAPAAEPAEPTPRSFEAESELTSLEELFPSAREEKKEEQAEPIAISPPPAKTGAAEEEELSVPWLQSLASLQALDAETGADLLPPAESTALPWLEPVPPSPAISPFDEVITPQAPPPNPPHLPLQLLGEVPVEPAPSAAVPATPAPFVAEAPAPAPADTGLTAAPPALVSEPRAVSDEPQAAAPTVKEELTREALPGQPDVPETLASTALFAHPFIEPPTQPEPAPLPAPQAETRPFEELVPTFTEQEVPAVERPAADVELAEPALESPAPSATVEPAAESAPAQSAPFEPEPTDQPIIPPSTLPAPLPLLSEFVSTLPWPPPPGLEETATPLLTDTLPDEEVSESPAQPAATAEGSTPATSAAETVAVHPNAPVAAVETIPDKEAAPIAEQAPAAEPDKPAVAALPEEPVQAPPVAAEPPPAFSALDFPLPPNAEVEEEVAPETAVAEKISPAVETSAAAAAGSEPAVRPAAEEQAESVSAEQLSEATKPEIAPEETAEHLAPSTTPTQPQAPAPTTRRPLPTVAPTIPGALDKLPVWLLRFITRQPAAPPPPAPTPPPEAAPIEPTTLAVGEVMEPAAPPAILPVAEVMESAASPAPPDKPEGLPDWLAEMLPPAASSENKPATPPDIGPQDDAGLPDWLRADSDFPEGEEREPVARDAAPVSYEPPAAEPEHEPELEPGWMQAAAEAASEIAPSGEKAPTAHFGATEGETAEPATDQAAGDSAREERPLPTWLKPPASTAPTRAPSLPDWLQAAEEAPEASQTEGVPDWLRGNDTTPEQPPAASSAPTAPSDVAALPNPPPPAEDKKAPVAEADPLLANARSLVNAGKLSESLEAYEKIVQRGPRLSAEVISDLEQLARRSDAPMPAHRLLGDAYAMVGRYKESLEQYRLVLNKQ